MIIAAEAFKELPAALQERVSEILKAHPDYAKWKASYEKYGAGLDLPQFIFMRASTWPDEIRRASGQERSYDHPHWHYVDWPLRPPDFPEESEPQPKDDVIFGIAECEKTLNDPKATPEIKAVYLSYLIHLVGDIHQPLHCASLFTDAYPHGDKGGNDFYVMPASRGIKLHAFWDQLLGSRVHERTQFNEAVRILSEHPEKSLPEIPKNKTAKAWSLEGRQLAIDKAYLNGLLKVGTSIQAAQSLPEGYAKEAKAVAERQAALAGYRLAAEIGHYLR